MVETNMIQWVQKILITYVIQIRVEINNENHTIVLIFENLQQRLTSDAKKVLEKIKPIILMPPSAYSSHKTQPCDACAFGASKTRYGQL